MTNKQPDALLLADEAWNFDCSEYRGVRSANAAMMGKLQDCADMIRRLHSENESLRTERDRNLNSIRVNNEIINKKLDENETLRTGYAAARLEIESLRARGAAPAGEYPALPNPVGWRDKNMHCDLYWKPSQLALVDFEPLFTEAQMRAYVDADRAMRAAQPAGAQQPGAAYAALSDAEIDRIVPALEPVSEDFPAEWAVWKDRERIREELRASHGQAPAQAAPAYKDSTPELHVGDSAFESWYSTYSPAHKADKQRARDAYAAGMGDPLVTAAPDVSGYVSEWSGGICTADEAMAGIAKLYGAQPTPTAVAGPHVTDAMALAFHSALSDGAIGSDEVEEIKAGLRAALAAAPTTQPAPQQEAQEPCPTCIALARTVMLDQGSFDRKPDCYGIRQITDDEGVEEWEDIRTSPDVAREEANDMMATGRGEIYEVVPLWTTPQPSPASQGDALDAARLHALDLARAALLACTKSVYTDMDGNFHPIYNFEEKAVSLALEAIDAARAAQEGKSHG